MKLRQRLIVCFAVIVALALVGGYLVESAKASSLQTAVAEQQEVIKHQFDLILQLRRNAILKDFDSYDALKVWVDYWMLNNRPIALSILNHTFVIAGNTELYSQYWDCDDISEAMQRDALREGYLMSAVLTDGRGSVFDVRVSELCYHVGCMTVTDNAYWFIEPQTGEIMRIAGRD